MIASSVGASVIVARWLGAEGLGALAVLNVTVAVALQIGSAGLPSANTYFIAPLVGGGGVWGWGFHSSPLAGPLNPVSTSYTSRPDQFSFWELVRSIGPMLWMRWPSYCCSLVQ